MFTNWGFPYKKKKLGGGGGVPKLWCVNVKFVLFQKNHQALLAHLLFETEGGDLCCWLELRLMGWWPAWWRGQYRGSCTSLDGNNKEQHQTLKYKESFSRKGFKTSDTPGVFSFSCEIQGSRSLRNSSLLQKIRSTTLQKWIVGMVKAPPSSQKWWHHSRWNHQTNKWGQKSRLRLKTIF